MSIENYEDDLSLDEFGFDDEEESSEQTELETEPDAVEYETVEDEVKSDTEEVENKGKKRKEKKRTSKKADEEAEPEIIPDKKLVILIDKYIPEFITYCRNAGLNVHSVFYKISDAEDFILFNSDTRLVVMETGVGKFNSIANRETLASLIGTCEEGKEVSVFFTDSVIKSDVKHQNKAAYNMVKWYKYATTVSTLAEMLQYKENYILDGSEMNDTSETEDEHLRGSKVDMTGYKQSRVVRMITPGDIRNNLVDAYGNNESKYESIEAFEPKY